MANTGRRSEKAIREGIFGSEDMMRKLSNAGVDFRNQKIWIFPEKIISRDQVWENIGKEVCRISLITDCGKCPVTPEIVAGEREEAIAIWNAE